MEHAYIVAKDCVKKRGGKAAQSADTRPASDPSLIGAPFS